MPLAKFTPKIEEIKAVVTAIQAEAPKAEKPVYTGRSKAAATDTMSKDDYWRRKEEHDLRKDPQIRLSGVFQALVESPVYGQYCPGVDRKVFLDTAFEDAKYVAKRIKEEAE